MALKDIFKVSFKTFLNPAAWLGYSELKRNIALTVDVAKDALTLPPSGQQETFPQALQRLGISQAQLAKTAQLYTLFVWLFLLLGAATIAVSFFYLIYFRTWSGWLIGIAASGLFFVQAFRYDFWLFQIRHRKLGCTFKEWRAGKLDDQKDTLP